jgi:hypothetical protein
MLRLKGNGKEPPLRYGELADTGWSDLQRRAIEELGPETFPNLSALGEEGRGVYLPAHVQTASFPLSAGGPLKCASLPGLRNELSELAQRWELPLDDEGLKELLRVAHDPDDGCVADAEILTFARPPWRPTRPSAATAPSGWSGNKPRSSSVDSAGKEPSPRASV